MNYSSLYDLIKSLKFGTKLQIGVIFLGMERNDLLFLPHEGRIHTAKYCWKLKEEKRMADKCFKCRQLAVRKAIKTESDFFGICINGVCEYTHPVIIDGKVEAIIFIGNILDEYKGKKIIEKRISQKNLDDIKDQLMDSFEEGIGKTECERIGALIESYIQMIHKLYPYSSRNDKKSILVKDVLGFIEENRSESISIRDIAGIFHYNPKYLGRLFKKEMGCSINTYICNKKLEQAKDLLVNTNLKIIEIATEVGFENVTYFNRRFFEYTFVTPSEYRMANKPKVKK